MRDTLPARLVSRRVYKAMDMFSLEPQSDSSHFHIECETIKKALGM